ncbi:MAG TPA: hypothetical protein VNW04_20380, partial [Puia sp.]|nr:hypothetical protein [Puia sp.]
MDFPKPAIMLPPSFIIRSAAFLPICFCISLLFYVSPCDAQLQGKLNGYYICQRYNLWVAQVKESGKDIDVKLLWINKVINLRPLTDSSFFNTGAPGEDSMIVTFRKNKDGAYTQLLLDGYGVWDRDKNYVPV